MRFWESMQTLVLNLKQFNNSYFDMTIKPNLLMRKCQFFLVV